MKTPELEQERQSFDCACLVIDIILKAKAGVLPMAEAAAMLNSALSDHMAKHTAVYGNRFLKPKHHWMFDVAMQMARDCMVLDAFIVERLHLTIRRASENISNLRTFEASVLSGAIKEQISKLQNMSGRCCLTQRSTQKGSFGFDDAEFADSMQVLGMHLSVDDLCFRGSGCGCICACALEHGVPFVVVDALVYDHDLSRHRSIWRSHGRLEVWPGVELEQAVAWMYDGGSLSVIRRRGSRPGPFNSLRKNRAAARRLRRD
jgi:hypothetical protein